MLGNNISVVPPKFCMSMVLNFCLGHCKDLEYNCRFSTLLTIKLEIRVSQKLEKLGGGEGGEGRPIKCQGWKGETIGVNCVAWEGGFQHWL